MDSPPYHELAPDLAGLQIEPFDERQFGEIYVKLDPTGIVAGREDDDDYLAPTFASNERKRLESLWYYTRHMRDDAELHTSCQHVSTLVKHFFGWEKIIVGLVDWNVFRPLLVENCPFLSGPRRESMCSHTVMFDPGAVFQVPDAQHDSRFRTNPNIRTGIGAYAGTPIRVTTIDGRDDVAIGSICVLSQAKRPELTEPESRFLTDAAELVSKVICERARAIRVEARSEMVEQLRRIDTGAQTATVVDEVLALTKRLLGEVEVRVVSRADAVPVGEKLVPTDRFVDGVWTDEGALDRIIVDHAPVGEPVRAVFADLKPDARLVIHTAEPRVIFDDLDVWFANRCCATIEGVQQREALDLALQTKTRFLRGLGADLRWPLHSILTFTHMLQEDKALRQHLSRNAATAASLGSIERSGNQLLEMIDDLLAVGRYERPDFKPVLEHILIDDIEADLVNVFDTTRRSRGIAFLSDNALPADLQLVYTDRELLVKCASILLENAFKFSEAGTTVTMSLGVAEDMSSMHLDVADQGVGIPAEDRLRIFDMFEKLTMFTSGSGIGLSVATSLARKIGASLQLLDGHARGACFRLSIPDPIMACQTRRAGSRGSYRMVGRDSAAVRHALERCGLSPAAAAAAQEGDCYTIEVLADQVLLARSCDSTAYSLAAPVTCKSLTSMLAAIEQDRAPRLPRPHSRERSADDAEVDVRRLQPTVLPTFDSMSQRPRVLLADDNPTNLRILEMYCKKRKLEHVSVVDGLEALDRYREHADGASGRPFELLLLDNQMPNMSGVEAIAEIRAFERAHPHLSANPAAIYIVSGISLPQDIERATEAGCDGYFAKPLRLATLDETILARFA